jgi:hypothetical protein
MGRYEIAKNKHKTPEQLLKEKKLPVPPSTFGFDTDPEDMAKRLKPFYAGPGEKNRVSLVFRDFNHVFLSSKVHYHGIYFLCKSTENHKEICCTADYHIRDGASPSSTPKIRYATIIAIYDQDDSNSFRVAPWVFGRRVFDTLKQIQKAFPLQEHDLMLVKTEEPFNPWRIIPTSKALWLDDSTMRERMISQSEYIKPSLKTVLASDLDPYEIQQIINRPADQTRRIFGQRDKASSPVNIEEVRGALPRWEDSIIRSLDEIERRTGPRRPIRRPRNLPRSATDLNDLLEDL